MRDNITLPLICAAVALWAVVSCSRDSVPADNSHESDNIFTVRAGMPENDTKVSLECPGSSLDLTARWQSDDVIKTLLDYNGSFLELPVSKIHDITADGKGCLFSFKLPEGYEMPENGYRIICFSMPPGTEVLKNPVQQGSEIVWEYALRRYPIGLYRATVYYEGRIQESTSTFTFRHLPVYEVLHFANKSGKTCRFSLNGFNSLDTKWWFSVSGRIKLQAGKNTQFVSGDVDNVSPSNVPTAATPQDKSQETFVADGAETLIISSYIPTGYMISGAQIVAEINGNIVYSVNRKSSDIALKGGNAYHLYAEWDGKELKFSDIKANGDVSGGGSGYGADDGGISGGGEGYGEGGTDDDINGTGSGYEDAGSGQEGDSGDINGSGSGYEDSGSGSNFNGSGSGYSE